jgi:hypothetical protein
MHPDPRDLSHSALALCLMVVSALLLTISVALLLDYVSG